MIRKQERRRRSRVDLNSVRAPARGRRVIYISFLVMIFGFIASPMPSALSAANSGITYNVSINGVSDRETLRLLEDVSNTFKLRKGPVASLPLLKMRIDQDISRMSEVLRSLGFYSSRVDREIDTLSSPLTVKFIVDPGPPYLLNPINIRIEGEAGLPPGGLPSGEDLGLTPGSPARSKGIVDATDSIRQWFMGHGFPFAEARPPRVIVDHSTRAVSVSYDVRPGPRAVFGPVEIKGLASVHESFVRGKIAWEKGAPFNAELINLTRKRLNDSGLFATVEIKTGNGLDSDGGLPVIIQVKERKHRTFKAGLSYSTDEGPGGKLSWENRNILGNGELLNFSGLASGLGYSAEGRFRRQEFLRHDQALILNLRLAEDSPDNFTSRNLTSTAQVERSLSKNLTVSAGAGFRRSRIDQLGVTTSFNLLNLPFNLDWDTSDDLLDPVRGGRLNIQAGPYYNIIDYNLLFTKGSVSYSRYFKLSPRPFLVLAAKGVLGATAGADVEDIPADIRFYSGGGGSVRGYAYQSIGPLQQGIPTGGRSLAGLSTELRTKITDSIGLVVFLDGGSVFEGAVPDFGEKFLWGTGLGFRYFTPFGPLRMDVGLPLNRREGVDDPFQIYISIGQAF